MLEEIDSTEMYYEELLKQAGPKGTDSYEGLVSEMFSQLDALLHELKQIETRHRLRVARYWGVPIPPWPDSDKKNQHWERSPYRAWVLSDEGHKHLRREIAVEVEIFAKPWLSWGAVVISVVSLVVAAFK